MTLRQLETLRAADFGGTPRSALRDIREIAADPALPPAARMARYLETGENPYIFRVGETAVQVVWTQTAATLQQRVTALLRELG